MSRPKLKLGAAVGGGTFHGCFALGTTVYALIVAPRETGEVEMAWSSSRARVAGAGSIDDGFANTTAMAEAGSELAQWAHALRIGDYDDWYVMSRSEALLAFAGSTKSSTFAKAWYWTSTQGAAHDEYAWIQHFNGGRQNFRLKVYRCRARAVRRVPIQPFDHSVILAAA